MKLEIGMSKDKHNHLTKINSFQATLDFAVLAGHSVSVVLLKTFSGYGIFSLSTKDKYWLLLHFCLEPANHICYFCMLILNLILLLIYGNKSWYP